MDKRQRWANIIATLIALPAAAVAFFVGFHYLGGAQSYKDVMVFSFAGLTVGIVVYVAVWGHFQSHFKGGLPEDPHLPKPNQPTANQPKPN